MSALELVRFISSRYVEIPRHNISSQAPQAQIQKDDLILLGTTEASEAFTPSVDVAGLDMPKGSEK